MFDDVYIVGTGMIRFYRYPEKSVKQMAEEAVRAVLADAGAQPSDIEAAWFSNAGWGILTGQHCIRGQVALTSMGMMGLPVTNVENACAGGATALHGAWTAVRAGLYDTALAVGVEKVYVPEEREKMYESFLSGTDVDFSRAMIAHFRNDAQRQREEAGDESVDKEGGHSGFMDIYAMGARLHMQAFGTTQEQLAMIASKNRRNGSLNPMAQFQKDMSVEDVLADKMVAYPLTRSMCAPIGDGSAAAIVCSERGLKNFPDAVPVKIRASVLASGSLPDRGMDSIGRRASRAVYEAAGIGPEDLDVVEVHDATAYGELMQYEELGLCATGEGGRLAQSGVTRIGGRMPVNPSGGLECRGHPVGASGLAQIFELVHQLRGDSGARQVEGARVAMAENGGGFIGLGEAAMSIHILEKA